MNACRRATKLVKVLEGMYYVVEVVVDEGTVSVKPEEKESERETHCSL